MHGKARVFYLFFFIAKKNKLENVSIAMKRYPVKALRKGLVLECNKVHTYMLFLMHNVCTIHISSLHKATGVVLLQCIKYRIVPLCNDKKMYACAFSCISILQTRLFVHRRENIMLCLFIATKNKLDCYAIQ